MANRIKVAIADSILTLRRQGWSLRRIARALELDRATVGRHVRRAEAAARAATNLSTGSDRGTDSNAASNPSTGSGPGAGANAASIPSPGKPGPESLCGPYRQAILEKLDQGLSAQRIWQDLASERGFTGGYASVKRFVRRLGQSTPLPFRRMECAAGDEAQIDFGPGAPVEQSSGRVKRYPVLRVILSHSRKGYSEALPRQGTEEFLRGLENAFRAFGGVPRTLVVDNLKAAVLKADWYDPLVNPKLQAFCLHYGCAVLPTKPYTPRHKGKVESGVKYVSENALKGRRFASLQEENEALQAWEAHVADLRIHGTTKQQVRALFERERPCLLPLPPQVFSFFHEAQRTVGRDAHVEVEKGYYSVPPEYLGHVVWVRWDAKMVRIFNGRMELIASHIKGCPGRFRTDPNHIASKKISSVERGAGHLLKRISFVGPETLRWAQAMLDQRGVEGVRVLQGLQAMAGKYRGEDLEKACALALSHGAYRLQSLRDLMKQPARQVEFVQAHPLIRPMDFYGRYLKVSFRKEEDAHGELAALNAPSVEAEEPAQALPAAAPESFPVNSLERIAP